MGFEAGYLSVEAVCVADKVEVKEKREVLTGPPILGFVPTTASSSSPLAPHHTLSMFEPFSLTTVYSAYS